MSKNKFTWTATQPQRNRELCQFNKYDQFTVKTNIWISSLVIIAQFVYVWTEIKVMPNISVIMSFHCIAPYRLVDDFCLDFVPDQTLDFFECWQKEQMEITGK